MRTTTNQSPRGTRHLPLAADITRPSALVMSPGTPARLLWRWPRALLIAVGTAAALAVLLGAGGLL